MSGNVEVRAIEEKRGRLGSLLSAQGYRGYRVEYIPYSTPETFIVSVSVEGRGTQIRGTFDDLATEITELPLGSSGHAGHGRPVPTSGGVAMAGQTPPDREHLEHLYAAMLRLIAIVEATGAGGVARAARDAQRELWPVIERLGGGQADYARWQEERLPSAGRRG